ncbi:MAG TPA: protein kinase, partial [Polyangia bacterium]|nr:protein kinase [Polyangia bacterium]
MIFAAATRSPIQFGAYLLTECVGQGGMAVVYKATRQGPSGFEKTVVVKAMLPTLTAQKEFVSMFSAEARLMAQLTHPNIVQVHDFGVVDGIPYLAMEYLPGRNLSQLRAAVDASCLRVPLGAALAIVREVCHGLGYAHDFVDSEGRKRQIIHRDVSPSNVMVCRDGSVKLLDFGVAKIVGEFDYDVTQSFKGKYAYMSPEQVNHKPIDRRVDVFAAGVVLHELLTGKRLFAAGTELETLQRVSAAKVVAPSVDNREVPRVLDTIVKKALAKDPSERYMSGAQMAEALDSLDSMIWPRKRLAAWLNELFARDWTITCDVCGKPVLAGGECGECGTAAPDGASPSVSLNSAQSPVVNEAQAALAPIFSSVNTERNVVGAQTIENAPAAEAPDEPLPLPPLPLSHSKKSRAQLSVVRTPLPPPLVEPDTAEHQAPTSGEIEMPGVDLYSAPKLFVVPEPVVPAIAPAVKSSASKSSPKRMALPARMHNASPTPEPPPTQVSQTSGMPSTIVDRKPTPKSMPVVQPPVETQREMPEVPEVEEATALRDQLTAKPIAPLVNPMSPRGFAPPQPTDSHGGPAPFGRKEGPELSPLQPQIDAPDPVPSVPAWSPLSHPKPMWTAPSGLAT